MHVGLSLFTLGYLIGVDHIVAGEEEPESYVEGVGYGDLSVLQLFHFSLHEGRRPLASWFRLLSYRPLDKMGKF